MPYELRCYELLIAIAFLGFYHRGALLIAGVATWAIYTFSQETCTVGCAGTLSGRVLILCFLAGMTLFRFRRRVPWSGWLASLALCASVALMLVPRGDLFAAVPMAYLTAFLGLLNPVRPKVLFGGDYSYGIFLYGFAVEQAIAAIGPWTHHWYINFGLAFPLVVAVAVCSWHFVEKPFLARKSVTVWLENRVLRVAAYIAAPAKKALGISPGSESAE